MKKTYIVAMVLITGLVLNTSAEPLESMVIHNYDYISGGYTYSHGGSDGVNAHGPFAEISIEEHDVVLNVNGGYLWGEEFSARAWGVDGSLGYVVRLADNRLNIIPRFGGGFSEISAEIPGFDRRGVANAWFLTPGATISYAIMDRLSLKAHYTYAYELESEEGSHGFGPALQFALFERVGLNLSAIFVEDHGFAGISSGIEFHY